MKMLLVKTLLFVGQLYSWLPFIRSKGIWRVRRILRKIGSLSRYLVVRRRGLKWAIINFKNDAEMSLALNDEYDRQVEVAISKFVKKGDVVIDIGANIGIFSLMLSQKTGKTGKVLSYEPSTFHSKTLAKNISINRIENILVFNVALGNKEGSAIHYTTESSGSLVSDYSEMGMKLVDQQQVEVVRLDTHLRSIDIRDPIRFIKIDVDGNEKAILEGAKNTIATNKPVIVFELAKPALEAVNQSALEILNILEAMRYIFLDNNSKICNSAQINSAFLTGDRTVVDVLAIPDIT